MGNSSRKFQRKKENEINQPNIVQEAKSEKRSGANGLFDSGFEYRITRCPRHTIGTSSTSDSYSWQDVCDSQDEFCCNCFTRLHHIESGNMITPNNRKLYIPDGLIFEEISCYCQEILQGRLQCELGFESIKICSELAREDGIEVLVSQEYGENVKKRHDRHTLIIIAGRGKSRAGVLSVKQLIESGLEIGSALFHIVQAKKRGFAVILLDPNSRGATNGMDTLDRSLNFLFGSYGSEFPPPPLYILAHSAGGGYLARYLSDGKAGQVLVENIRSLIFTDSTHNIQWFQEDPVMLQFLQSSMCLYIRNTSENPSDTFSNHKDKKAGEHHEGDIWWQRRFGKIRTVWAGTTEHSLMCWAARDVVWKHFDGNK